MDNLVKKILYAAKWIVHQKSEANKVIDADACVLAILRLPEVRDRFFEKIHEKNEKACKPLPEGWLKQAKYLSTVKFSDEVKSLQLKKSRDFVIAVCASTGQGIGSLGTFKDIQSKEATGKGPAQEEAAQTKPSATKAKWREFSAQLKNKIIGQNQAVDQVSQALMTTDILGGNRAYKGPKQILTFMGPPGVGKTMLAESMSELLEGYSFKRLNMADYSTREDAAKLIGDAEKYQGTNKGAITQQVADHPKTVFLFDEIEKAHPIALNAFLSLLDAGHIDDQNTLKRVDFSQCIVIFTTNLGKPLYIKDKKGLLPETADGLSKDMLASALRTFEKDDHGFETKAEGVAKLTPEFISRLQKGELILFRHLRSSALLGLARHIYSKSIDGIKKSINLTFPKSLTDEWLLMLMLNQGKMLDARRLTVSVADFVEKIAIDAVDLFDEKAGLIFSNIQNNPVLKVMQDLKKEMTVLLLEDEIDHIEQYRKVFPDIRFESAMNIDELQAALRKDSFSMVLLDLHIGKNRKSNEMDLGLSLLNALREQEPLLPVYAFSELAGARGVSDEMLNQVVEAGGVRQVVAKEKFGIEHGESFHNQTQVWIEQVLAEKLVKRYLAGSKRLTFQTSIMKDGKFLVVAAENLREEIELGVDALGQGLVTRPQISFRDVAGAHHAKQRLMEIVGWLNNPKQLKALGIGMPKGVLLHGVPGTGKTLLAKAVAGEAGLPFIAKTGSEFIKSIIGASGKAVRDTFEAAAECAPCILFIDEIDALGSRQESGSGNSANSVKEIINQFLACMDGFAADAGVFVIAATNYPDSLDPALLRPGRFDNEIEVELPNKEGRLAILQIHAGKAALASEVSLNDIVRLTPGFSGAKLAQIVKEAGFLALRFGRDEILQGDLLEAVNTLSMGMAKIGLKTSADDLKRTAIHEAGHAIAGHLLEPHKKLVQLTIMPRANALGFAQHEADEGGDTSLTEQELINHIQVLLAGRAAEAIVLPEAPRSTGASNDLERATQIIIKMLISYGMLDRKWQGYSMVKDLSALPENLMLDVNNYLEKFEQEVTKQLKENRKLLDTFSDTLLEKETLGESELKLLFK